MFSTVRTRVNAERTAMAAVMQACIWLCACLQGGIAAKLCSTSGDRHEMIGRTLWV